MRIIVFTAALLSTCIGIPGADLSGSDSNPYIKLSHVIRDGTLRISAKNISHKPILAYVVAVEDGGQSTTHHDFYTGRDVFRPGKTIELMFAAQSASSTPKVFVDYVRLSDSSTWGNRVTEDAKDVAASFQK
jgi:hypothetical protein